MKQEENKKEDYLQILQKALREKQNLNRKAYTLRSFAQKLNISHSMLSQILAGKKRPSLQLLRLICSFLEISITDSVLAEDSLIIGSNKNKKYLSSELISPDLNKTILHSRRTATGDFSKAELAQKIIDKAMLEALAILDLGDSRELIDLEVRITPRVVANSEKPHS